MSASVLRNSVRARQGTILSGFRLTPRRLFCKKLGAYTRLHSYTLRVDDQGEVHRATPNTMDGPRWCGLLLPLLWSREFRRSGLGMNLTLFHILVLHLKMLSTYRAF